VLLDERLAPLAPDLDDEAVTDGREVQVKALGRVRRALDEGAEADVVGRRAVGRDDERLLAPRGIEGVDEVALEEDVVENPQGGEIALPRADEDALRRLRAVFLAEEARDLAAGGEEEGLDGFRRARGPEVDRAAPKYLGRPPPPRPAVARERGSKDLRAANGLVREDRREGTAVRRVGGSCRRYGTLTTDVQLPPENLRLGTRTWARLSYHPGRRETQVPQGNPCESFHKA
jgi:hypothetical protein